jgi:CLIP-associating protein 1/2
MNATNVSSAASQTFTSFNSLQEALTVQEFVRSFEKLKRPLSLPESEDSWEQIYKGFDQLGRLCQRGAFEHTLEFISSLRSIHRNVVGAMNSERTRLSGVALDLLGTVASGLSSDFEPLLPLFFPSLLSLCARTNKVVVSRAKICIVTIVEVTQLPSILIYLAQSAKDKSPSVRLVVTEVTLSCLKCFNPPDLEKENLSSTIEAIIRSSARDANAEIRKVGKDIFQSYKVLLPDRVER